MGLIQFILHVLNFLAPALFVALLVPEANRYVLRNPNPRRKRWIPAAIQFAVGVAVLLAGLVLFGVDGKMLTYLALVLAGATCQWLLTQGWKS